jgi:hypothetical protein
LAEGCACDPAPQLERASREARMMH